jgi:hypothetical protein
VLLRQQQSNPGKSEKKNPENDKRGWKREEQNETDGFYLVLFSLQEESSVVFPTQSES